ncbi:FAD binding domain-containing protein [Candidatus Poribacteria bacterium]|nr:FAD binding domain-containing protein [Candidatus Poribacteria bacterium]
MTVGIVEYHRPRDLGEALALLAEGGRPKQPVGGGVSIAQTMDTKAFDAVDLGHLHLDKIKIKSGKIHLGAMVTLGDMHRHPEVAASWGGLFDTAMRGAGTSVTRNLFTVGGNIVQCYYWSTLPPILLALDAVIHIENAKGGRDVGAEEFFSKHPIKNLRHGDLVTEVTIPLPKADERACFLKFAATVTEYALVQTCVKLRMKKDVCQEARVVLGALTTIPYRSHPAEHYLEGKTLTHEVCGEAARLGVEKAHMREDHRTSSEYRREIAGVYVRRALESLVGVKATNGKGAAK